MHSQAPSCRGEKCRCGNDAYHKIGEEVITGDPTMEMPGMFLVIGRHNLTTYVCCECFEKIMGPAAKKVCEEWSNKDGIDKEF